MNSSSSESTPLFEKQGPLNTLPGEISFSRLLWQLSSFMLGILLLLGSHLFFKQLIDDLNISVVNEQERLLIGELIIQNIQKIETEVYRMAATNGVKGQEIILKGIDEQIGALEGMLEVLAKGGTVNKQIGLNMQGRDEMIRKITYQAKLYNDAVILEVIELAPKIGEVRERINQLFKLLQIREENREAGDAYTQLTVISQVKDRLKIFYPMFVRLKENANRLFVKGNQRLTELETAIHDQQKFYYILEITLFVFIFISILIFGYISVIQIVRSNRQLRVAHDSMENAKHVAERANKAKSEFLSNMSHELRTPLNAILGFAQLLALELGEDSKKIHKLSEISKAGNHLLSLVNDVLDLAKVESGNIEFNLQPLLVESIVQEALGLIAQTAKQKSIEIEFKQKAPGTAVLVDRIRLRQILLNLLSNGIKYNHEKGNLSVLCERIEDQRIRISVIDSGYGIDNRRYKELFKPFSRLGYEGELIEGSGIGLMLTKQLVEKMGGSLDFSSTLGRGSSFWIEFTEYVDKAAGSDTSEDNEIGENIYYFDRSTLLSGGSETGNRILLVEDNPTNRILLEQQLIALGYSLETAKNGEEGMQMLATGKFNLILTDCSMPVMDGYEMTRLIRKQEAGSEMHIPIVAITANALEGDAEHCFQSGMDDYLSKPVSLVDLQSTLNKWLPLRNSEIVEEHGNTVSSMSSICTDISADDEMSKESSTLDILVGKNSILKQQLLAKYQQDAADTVKNMKNLLSTGSSADIGYQAYLLKSSARVFGLEELMVRAEKIEITVAPDRVFNKEEAVSIGRLIDDIQSILTEMNERQENSLALNNEIINSIV